MSKVIAINGMGWISDSAYGTSKKEFGKLISKNGIKLPDRELLFTEEVVNFRRFDYDSKLTCSLVALAIKDAFLNKREKKERTGIIGFGKSGSNSSDKDYYQDFLKFGEKTGRGHIFIYTLPTSPLAESAIYFKIMGPLYYLSKEDNLLRESLESALRLIRTGDVDNMFVGSAEDFSFYILIGEQHKDSICLIDDIKMIETNKELVERIRAIRLAKNIDNTDNR